MSNARDDALNPIPDAITVKHQRRAADPHQSAWVSANAGSGKTYVLSTRVIRLLLDGIDPSKLLCLTYTKTAAAEMKNRVFSRLGDWVTMDDALLKQAITEVTGKSPNGSEMTFARTLFARALETPGGLKIQTIHAFCEALLHRFPLEANIAGHFELVDDRGSVLLIAQARRLLLTGQDENAVAAVQRLLLRRGETGLQEILDEIIGNRAKFEKLLGDIGSTMDERRAAYLAAFGFQPDETPNKITKDIWSQLQLTHELMRSLRDEAAAKGKKRVYEFGYELVQVIERRQEPNAFDLLCRAMLKADGEPYGASWLFGKDMPKLFPSLCDKYEADAALIGDALNRINLLDEIDQTLDALMVADRLLALYSTLKNQRGFLDFEDLIGRTENMLGKENIAAWVRYKLDQGIDHILIDEAQDTSPAQWRVIKTLADEFFDGEGARDVVRSVFAVGDEKQSIYSFQGARPAEFADARDHFAKKLRDIEKPLSPLNLEASFRSTRDVLAAVDHVFSYADHRKGLAPRQAEPQRHRSLRENQPGYVEVWQAREAVKSEDEEDWTMPVDHAQKPAVVVAERIAQHIKNWLDKDERLEATGRKIKPGDILVLVRKRDAFVHALSKALKEHNVPVAGADRLQMTQHIAVMDMMALGRIMLHNHDDLSLAALLRSPIFGWSDEQLFDLAHGRGTTPLYEQMATMLGIAHVAAAYQQLRQWKNLAANLSVFEFYSQVLLSGGVRARLIGRLGPETSDMLDEFLSYIIAQERDGPVSLETFINTLGSFAPEIKREMDGKNDEVRIMTVHGAKGLEAPVVFLVDPGSAAFTASKAPKLLPLDLKVGLKKPLESVLCANGGGQKSHISKSIIETLKQSVTEEYNRLLYVGMTRAADRLIVAGYQGLKGGGPATWRTMVETALSAHSQPIDYGDFSAIRFAESAPIDPHPPVEETDRERKAADVPSCFDAPAPAEPPAARPLVPSGASGLAVEADRQASDGEVPKSLLSQFQVGGDKADMSPALAAKRGTLIHKLLQMLPAISVDQRRERAEHYCANSDSRWTKADIDSILRQVFGVLDNPAYAPFFVPGSLAEVSVMGMVDIGGEQRAVSGVIDRISVVDDAVYIVDYKTNANPPRTLAQVPDLYRRQMALYSALVAPLYPGKIVHTALLFTSTPQLIALDSQTLEKALADLAPASV